MRNIKDSGERGRGEKGREKRKEKREKRKEIGKYVSGSVGVLIKGYKKGKLNKNELQESIDLLFNDSSLYLSRAFRYKVLKLVEQQEEAQ